MAYFLDILRLGLRGATFFWRHKYTYWYVQTILTRRTDMNAIYHIYPLGACGAPQHNHPGLPVCYRLAELEQWIPHWQSLSIDTVYLGPVLESESHGYDPLDFFQVDRRLGDAQTLRNLVHALHAAGMRVVLDAVFNHVGRGFFAFQDVLQKREKSRYTDWFSGLRYTGNNVYNDGLQYADWNGCQNLVKLNGSNPEVVAHLLVAVESWIRDFHIDGLRLDAADALEPSFIKALRTYTDSLRPDFWLLGEMVHGDYNRLLGPDKLHSVTNYELYKSLYSSCNDGNLYELAYAVNRQSSPNAGIYSTHKLYTFVDNHDVNRITSTLNKPAHLYPLYILQATLPGIPSVYYGSEWCITGTREPHSDQPLRPRVAPTVIQQQDNHPMLKTLRRLLALRASSAALRAGQTRQVKVDARQYAFVRSVEGEHVLVCVNLEDQPVHLRLDLPEPLPYEGEFCDLLDDKPRIQFGARTLYLEVPPCGGRVLGLG